MTPDVLYAVLERVHGHLALLGLAVLLHPVVALGRARRVTWRMQLTADLGAALLVVPFLVGNVIYPTYRSGVKPELLAHAPAAASAFETKEHLAVFAVSLAVAGALTLRMAGQLENGRRAGRSLCAAAWVCGVLTGVLGIWVSGHAHPGW